jgi:methionine sulfoxide reductase heme-binding subunit
MAGTNRQRRAAAQFVTLPPFSPLYIYGVGFLPAMSTFWLGFTDRLGADPLRTLELTLGLWALRFLIATLCVTPLRDVGVINLLRYRRALGLLTFYYVLLHLGVWLILDQGLDPHAIAADILRRPYITIGMLAFAIMLPLALTSTSRAIKALGPGRWAALHKLVYAAAIAAALHFVMVVKSWPLEPLVYAGIVAALLLYRLAKKIRQPVARQKASA